MYSLIKFSFIELRIKYLKIYNEKKKDNHFHKRFRARHLATKKVTFTLQFLCMQSCENRNVKSWIESGEQLLQSYKRRDGK